MVAERNKVRERSRVREFEVGRATNDLTAIGARSMTYREERARACEGG